MSPALKIALLKALKVFVYSGLSAVIPVVVAFLQNDPRYVLFAPVVNTVLVAILRYFREKYPESIAKAF